MVQIKVSVAFVLAAAAIAPAVAQPTREGREHTGHVGDHHHHHHGHHHGHHHHHKASAEQPIPEPTPETPTAREYEDEFEVIAREYAEFEDMFERGFEDAESGSKIMPHLGRPRPFRGAFPPIFGRPLHGAHPPIFGRPLHGAHPPIFGRPLHLGHGPVVLPHHRPGTPHRIQFGHGPVVLRHGSARPKAFTREYIESDDMFERDFEDLEFDARDFDDELYLD